MDGNISPKPQSSTGNEARSKKCSLKKILGFLFCGLIVLYFAFDGYTYLMGMVHKGCAFDGVYTYVEDPSAIVCIFDGDEMVLYTTDGIYDDRISCSFQGSYYNKGFFGRFLDFNDKWIKIPDAEKAGQFHVTCQTCISTSAWGDFQYLDADELKALGEEDSVNYSKTFFFTVQEDLLTLVSFDAEGSLSIPFTKVRVLTGDLAETVEILDMLWENEFGG